MSTEYTGANSYTTITIPEDSDAKDAASVAVALEQLADRTAYLNALITGGVDLDFTDATFHGTTTFADGDIVATLDSFALTTTGAVVIVADSVDLLGGHVLVDATHIELADDVSLGGGTGDTVTVVGALAANHNATFAAGKIVDLDGVTVADDLRATVSNAAGIVLTSQGNITWRTKTLVDGDFSLGLYIASPFIADIFECDALTADRAIKLEDSTPSFEKRVIEFSFRGMTGGHTVTIYAEDEVTVLLVCTATSNCYSRWRRKSTGNGWRLLTAANT